MLYTILITAYALHAWQPIKAGKANELGKDNIAIIKVGLTYAHPSGPLLTQQD
jgi:hypothetical protein